MNTRDRRPIVVAVIALLGGVIDHAAAHSGRRFAIEVVGGQLQAQGVNTGPSDGAPAVRPYPNALHDHWRNAPSLGLATASLPGFDITPSASTALTDHRVDLQLTGVTRWLDPTITPTPSTIPLLRPLGGDRVVSIHGPNETVDSRTLGSLLLTDSVTFGGVRDLDLVYEANWLPHDEIHVLQFRLSATPLTGGKSPITPSEAIYVLLSPDGANHVERLHAASLFLEEYLATIPEPSAGLLVALAILFGPAVTTPRGPDRPESTRLR